MSGKARGAKCDRNCGHHHTCDRSCCHHHRLALPLSLLVRPAPPCRVSLRLSRSLVRRTSIHAYVYLELFLMFPLQPNVGGEDCHQRCNRHPQLLLDAADAAPSILHWLAQARFLKPGIPVNLPHTSALTASLLASLRFAAAAAASSTEAPASAAPATQHASERRRHYRTACSHTHSRL